MSQIKNTEIRRVQALTGERSFTVVLPRSFSVKLGITKGDFMSVSLKGNQLILQKAQIVREEKD